VPPPAPLDCFADLYRLLVERGDADVFADILTPALPRLRELMVPLSAYRLRDERGGYTAADEHLWEWFALAAVNDHLLTPLAISAQHYRRFFEQLGMDVFDGRGELDPLLHEIVEVGTWTRPHEGVAVSTCFWPGLMYGEMVFARAGVLVLAHPDLGIVKGIADRSTLYFANRRINRPAEDLSHGWGSNSRWRTRFHRNYLEPTQLVFNVEGTYDLADEASYRLPASINADLPIAARRELLIHRCFVSHPGPSHDHFPYDDTLVIRGRRAWPLDESTLVPRARLT
jgi:hypothetical protein